MAKSILNHKKLLLVGDAQEISGLLEQTILIPCPHCCIEKATTYEDAVTLLISKHYDLVFLDMVEAWGSELLKVAVERNFKVIVLTSNGLNTEDLNKAYHLGAVAYLPTTLLDELITFSEDMLKHDSIAASGPSSRVLCYGSE